MVKETKSAKKPVPSADRDELAQVIADSLNKLYKDGQVAYFLDGEEETPTDLTDFISTGNTMLDIAISNRPNGGIAAGRITELTGLEASGKSLVGASLIATTQKRGGVAVLIDTENAVNDDFFTAVGVDMKKLVYVQHDTVEDIFDSIVNIIEKVRAAAKKDKLVTIVVDSVAAASTKTEMAADFNKDGYATAKSIIISKAMRKITNLLGREKIALVFTNQLRQKMNAPAFSDPYTTSGGKAIGFHASTRIRLSQIGKLKDSVGNIIGITTKAVITKNRLGPPYREAEFNIYFNRGIDDYSSWLEVLKDNGIIKQSGAWYSYEEDKFQSKDFPTFLESNQERKAQLYDKICEAVIMKYEKEFDPASISKEVTDGEDEIVASTKQLLMG
jgi:recombination protein RecA